MPLPEEIAVFTRAQRLLCYYVEIQLALAAVGLFLGTKQTAANAGLVAFISIMVVSPASLFLPYMFTTSQKLVSTTVRISRENRRARVVAPPQRCGLCCTTRALIHTNTHLPTHSLTCLLTHSLTHSLRRRRSSVAMRTTLTHSLTHSPHSHTHTHLTSLTHSLTHSLTQKTPFVRRHAHHREAVVGAAGEEPNSRGAVLDAQGRRGHTGRSPITNRSPINNRSPITNRPPITDSTPKITDNTPIISHTFGAANQQQQSDPGGLCHYRQGQTLRTQDGLVVGRHTFQERTCRQETQTEAALCLRVQHAAQEKTRPAVQPRGSSGGAGLLPRASAAAAQDNARAVLFRAGVLSGVSSL